MADFTDMLSPQEAAVRQAERQVDAEQFLELVRQQSEKLIEASNAPQIIPGTGKTAGMLMQESQAQLETQNRVQKIAAATDWDNLAVTLGQDIAQLAHQQRAITSKIAKDSSVSFFDDPLTAIANAFTLPWDEQALAGVEKKLETTTRMANAAHNHVQQSASTADKIKTAITQENLAEQATALEAYQTRLAANARIEAAKTGADAIKQAMDMDGRALNIYMQAKSLAHSEEQMEMARSREERQMQLLDKQMKEVKAKEDSEAELLRYANMARTDAGMNQLDVKRFEIYKRTSAEYLDSLVRKGLEIEGIGADKVTFGSTIEDRFKYTNIIGWKPKTDQQMSIMLMQRDADKTVPPSVTDKKQRAVEANGVFNKQFRSAQDDIREGSAFSAPSLEVYSRTATANNPIWQKYIAPTITEENKNTPMTPQYIRKVIGQAVVDKTVTSSQAAEFATEVFNRAMEINNTTHEFNKIAGQEQTKYGVRMPIGISTSALIGTAFKGMTGGGFQNAVNPLASDMKQFNAANKTEWQALIARDIAMDMLGKEIVSSMHIADKIRERINTQWGNK